MKQIKIILLFTIILLFLSACTAPESSEPAVQQEGDTTSTEITEEVGNDDSVDMTEEMEGETAVMEESISEEVAEDNEEMAEHSDSGMVEDGSHDAGSMAEAVDDVDMMDSEEEDMEEVEESMSATTNDWLSLPLTNASTGETFTLADFAGKTVYVEPMATWCTNCRRQLNTLNEARAELSDDVVIIGLSVEPNLADDVLASYAGENRWNWSFAVATPELIEAMVAQYGRSVANPPGTPHFIISPDGSLSELFTGFHPADEIITQIEASS